jgi:hypothetical protein
MKVKSSVLFGLIVLTCLAGGISLIYRLTKEAEVWNPSEMYKTSLGTSKGTKCTTVSYTSGSTSDAPLVQLGAGSMSRPRVSFSYAPAGVASAYTQYPIGGTSSYSLSPLASSPQGGLYTTSSAEFRSFGGGGNADGGVSMSGGTIKSTSSSIAPATSLSISMPSTQVYTYNNGVAPGEAVYAAVIKEALEATPNTPDFVTFDAEKMSGEYVRLPERKELNQQINELLVVEFYNRKM